MREGPKVSGMSEAGVEERTARMVKPIILRCRGEVLPVSAQYGQDVQMGEIALRFDAA